MLTKMEARQCTPSVLARLMGLDELAPHQPVHKKQKVLSENYLRRLDSIGVRKNRLSHERHSFRLRAEQKKDFNDAQGVEVTKVNLCSSGVKEVCSAQGVVDNNIDLFMKYLQKPDSLITKCLHDVQGIPHNLQSGCSTIMKSSNASNTGKTDICSISKRETDQETVRLLRKLETGLVTDSFREHVLGNRYKFLRSRRESDTLPTDIFVLKPKLGKEENAARCFLSSSSCRDSHSINKKHKEFLSPEKGNLYVEEKERKSMGKDMKPVRLRFRIPREISRQTVECKKNLFMKIPKSGSRDSDTLAEKSELKTFSSPNSCDWKNNQQPSFFHSDGSCVSRVARKEILEGWKTTKKFQEVKVASRTRTLGEMLAMPDQESSPGNSHCGFCESGYGSQKKLEEKDLSEQSSVATKSSVNNVVSANMVAEMVTDAETVDEGRSSENHKEQPLEMTGCMLLVEDGYFSSQVPDAATQQDLPIGMLKEDSASSFCYCTDPESLLNSEAYQPSPNSVLEPPFEEEISSTSVCFPGVDTNLQGLQLQLELLKSESLEAYSEGAGMVVSSDDELEGSVSYSEENEEFLRISCIEESRDFSYLVDLFTEAGFHGRNLGMSYETWHSPECPISPAVFEMLEKKYGEQMSWKKSERRLLFDRINSELIEILQPSIRIHSTKLLSTRLCLAKSFDMIEEKLWMLLNHQDKQANKDSSVKVLGKDDGWLELGDDIEVIVREIENSLVDQLAKEIVSVESF